VQALLDIDATAGDAISASSFTTESGDLDIEATNGDIVGSVFYAKGQGTDVGSAFITAGDEFDHNVVETYLSMDVAASWINGSTFVSETGYVDLEATKGDIVAGSATAKQSYVDVLAKGNIDALSIDAYTYAVLNATNVLNGSVTAQTDSVTVNAGQFISNQDINAATFVSLDAVLDVVGSSVLAGGMVTVGDDALVRSLHTTQIVAGGPIDINLSEEMDGSTANSLSTVNVDANNVTNSNVDADGLIDVNAATNITNSVFKGDLAGVLAVDLEAGEAIRNVDVLATNGSAKLNAIASEIDATDVQALLDIEADAGTYIVASSFIAEEGSIDIEAHDGNIVATSVVLKDDDGSAD